MSRYFESAADRNQENSVARVLESGAVVVGGPLSITASGTGTFTGSAVLGSGAAVTGPSTLWKGAGAIPSGHIEADLALLNCSWFYDWASTSVPGHEDAPSFQYVPMMWGDWERSYGFNVGGTPAESIGTSSILLGFNEPEISAQADMTVARALALWPQLEATGARLGSPGISANGQSWLADFMDGNGVGYVPRVDFICMHWYVDYDGTAAQLATRLDSLHATYGKPIWITECGSLTGGTSGSAAFMSQVMDVLATRPWVERLAWFTVRDNAGWTGTGMVESDGTLNAAGTAYASYPSGGDVSLAPLDPTFTEMWTGTNGAGWGSQWTHHDPLLGGAATATIQSNRGRQVASGASYAFAFDTFNESVTDFDLTISYACGDVTGEQYPGIFYRADPAATVNGFPRKCYLFGWDPSSNGAWVQKVDAAGTTTDVQVVNSAGINTTERRYIRLKVDGFRHRVRWWKVGDTEPTTWQINALDDDWITGQLSLGLYNGDDAVSRSIDWDDFALVGAGMWKGTGVIRYNLAGDPVYYITDDLDVLNASWWYGWDNETADYATGAPGTVGNNYVPMQWGDWEHDYGWSYGGPPDAAAVGDSGTLLGFNEPDQGSQSNVSVARALTLWPQLEATGLRLGSPAATTGGFNSWLTSFVSGNGGGYIPRVDFICCHWYPDFNGGYSTIGAYLDAVHAAFPTKPIWLTEVGHLTGGPSANAALIPVVMQAVFDRPYVERVGWFCQRDGDNFTGSGLIDNTGTITSAGTVFASFLPVPNEMPPSAGTALAVTASGTGTSTGTATTALKNAITASGTGTSTGTATTALKNAITASGTGTSTGVAAITIKAANAHQMSAGGTGTFDGSAAMLSKLVASSYGTGFSQGAASIAQGMLTSASGTGTFSGVATFAPIQMSASGVGVFDGAVSLLSKLAITATSGGTIDEDFNDGVAGQSIDTTGYVTAFSLSGPLQFDGAGNVQTVTGGAFGLSQHAHTTTLSDDSWTEVTVLKAVTTGEYELRIALRSIPTNINAGYTLLLTSGTWVLGRAGTQIASGLSGAALAVGTPGVFRLEAYGGLIRVFRDGVEMGTYTDPTPLYAGPYTGFGFYCQTKGHILVQRHQAGSLTLGGSAAISTGSPMSAAGTGVSDGSAALTISNGPIAHQMSASGAGLSIGSAALLSKLVITSAGTGITSATVTLGLKTPYTASGTGLSVGSAALRQQMPIAAQGQGATTGTATLVQRMTASASGVGTFSGQAVLNTASKLSMSASGISRFTGNAFLSNKSGFVDLDVVVGPIRIVATVAVGPMRVPTQVGDFDMVAIEVGSIRLVDKYTFGAMTAPSPVTVGTFKTPTVVSGFKTPPIVVGELRADSPVTVGV